MKNLKKIARLLLVVFTLSCLSSSANAGLIAGALGGGIVKKKPSFMGKVVKQLAIGTVVVGGAYLLNKKLQEQEEIKRQEAIEEQLKQDQRRQELERQNADRSTPPFIADTTNNSIPETVASDNEEAIPPYCLGEIVTNHIKK